MVGRLFFVLTRHHVFFILWWCVAEFVPTTLCHALLFYPTAAFTIEKEKDLSYVTLRHLLSSSLCFMMHDSIITSGLATNEKKLVVDFAAAATYSRKYRISCQLGKEMIHEANLVQPKNGINGQTTPEVWYLFVLFGRHRYEKANYGSKC